MQSCWPSSIYLSIYLYFIHLPARYPSFYPSIARLQTPDSRRSSQLATLWSSAPRPSPASHARRVCTSCRYILSPVQSLPEGPQLPLPDTSWCGPLFPSCWVRLGEIALGAEPSPEARRPSLRPLNSKPRAIFVLIVKPPSSLPPRPPRPPSLPPMKPRCPRLPFVSLVSLTSPISSTYQ